MFSHTFYGLADGSALAFFNFADKDIQARILSGPQKNLCYHIALSVDAETQQQIVDRCAAAHIETAVIDHGYCKSLYVTDPDGLQVEFTVDAPNVDEINAYQRRVAHKSLQAWMSGDTRPNNNVRAARLKGLLRLPRSANTIEPIVLRLLQVAMRLYGVSQRVGLADGGTATVPRPRRRRKNPLTARRVAPSVRRN